MRPPWRNDLRAPCWILLIVACVGGCPGEDATQIMVAVRTDYRVPPNANAELDRITIRISQEPGTEEVTKIVSLDADTKWPATLAVTPGKDSDTAFVQVAGERDGAVVISQSAFVRFVPNHQRLLTVDLEHRCADVVCDGAETCRAGTCESRDRRQETLPAWTGKAPNQLEAAKLCSGTWSAPAEISVTENTDYDDDPSFTADILEFYFASGRAGGLGREDIYVATRETADGAWGLPELVPNVNSAEAEETPQISRDGLRLWFARAVNGNDSDKDVFVSTRPSRGDDWSAPVAVHFWDESGSYKWKDRDVAEYDNGRRIVLSSNHTDNAASSGYDIFIAEQKVPGDITQWTTPIRLSQLSEKNADDMGPFPSEDGSRIYFHRLEQGAEFADLYVAQRIPLSGEYGTPTPITELNKPGDYYEQDMEVSDDECFAMFSREYVEDNKNISNVYITTRSE